MRATPLPPRRLCFRGGMWCWWREMATGIKSSPAPHSPTHTRVCAHTYMCICECTYLQMYFLSKQSMQVMPSMVFFFFFTSFYSTFYTASRSFFHITGSSLQLLLLPIYAFIFFSSVKNDTWGQHLRTKLFLSCL